VGVSRISGNVARLRCRPPRDFTLIDGRAAHFINLTCTRGVPRIFIGYHATPDPGRSLQYGGVHSGSGRGDVPCQPPRQPSIPDCS
jgi:hypothetical protein